jgi:hypothetical protein
MSGVAATALLLAACATPPAAAQPSPYTAVIRNTPPATFMAEIRGPDLPSVARMELWYRNRRVADFRILRTDADRLEALVPGSFSQFVDPFAEIRMYTRTGEVHRIPVGDPYLNDGVVHTGAVTRL